MSVKTHDNHGKSLTNEPKKHASRYLEVRGKNRELLDLGRSEEPKGLRTVQACREALDCPSSFLFSFERGHSRGNERSTSLRYAIVRSTGTFISGHQSGECGRQDGQTSSLGVFKKHLLERTRVRGRQRQDKAGWRKGLSRVRAKSVPEVLRPASSSQSRKAKGPRRSKPEGQK